MNKRLPLLFLPLLLACAAPAFAQQAPPLPEWDKLTPAQREALIAPVRERWNNTPPERRQNLLDRAQRWQQYGTRPQCTRGRSGCRSLASACDRHQVLCDRRSRLRSLPVINDTP